MEIYTGLKPSSTVRVDEDILTHPISLGSEGTLWDSQFPTSATAARSCPHTAVHRFNHLHQHNVCSSALHKRDRWIHPLMKEIFTHVSNVWPIQVWEGSRELPHERWGWDSCTAFTVKDQLS